jgi:two-component system, NtrC family, response regulator
MNKLLIIDDEEQIRKLLSRLLELEGYEVYQASDCRLGLKQAESFMPQVILCDVRLPDGNGVDLIAKLKKVCPLTEIIMLTAHGNIPDGVQAIKNGAFDYITKGDDNNKIIPLISRALEKALMNKRLQQLEAEVGMKYSFDSILGKSKQIQDAISLARKVAITDIPVLLTGETGTGKEVFAQSIHVAGNRYNKSFVAINCSAFSKDLLASEMFGHKAGSFTGATKDKKGLFEEANNGTIFLDEIGEMEFELQAKLLRIIETGEFLKIGDTKPTKVNVRIIAATNRNLQKEIEENRFREDLFYRLSVFQIHLPSLRDRSEDIELIATSFIEIFAAKLGRRIRIVSPDYMDALKRHTWRGNIRELRNVIERSLIVCSDESLTLQDLPIEILNDQLEEIIGKNSSDFEMSGMERRHIARVLQYSKGNKTETARLLKIGLTTLYRKIEEYGLQ